MKRLLALLLVLCTLNAYARVKVKDPMVITDSITITTSVKPDIMESGMSVQFNSADYAAVSSAMEKIASAVKASKDICTYSGYNISPDYKYKDGNRITDGYIGLLDFECRFSSLPAYEKTVNSVFAIADSDPAYILSSKQVAWSVSQKTLDAARSQMKTEAIKSVLKTAKDYSKAAGLYCSAKDINLEYSDFMPAAREYASMRTAKAALAVSEPDKTDRKVELFLKYNFVCR